MFKKPESRDGRTAPMIPSSDQTSIPKTSSLTPATIGPTIHIKGDVLVTGKQGVHIDGHVDGTITLNDNVLSVGKEGHINATIDARAIYIEGRVDGDLKGDEQVVIQSSGNVRGNIAAPRVILEDGCKFKGFIDMDVEPSTVHASDSSRRSGKITGISSSAESSGEVSSSDELGKAQGP